MGWALMSTWGPIGRVGQRGCAKTLKSIFGVRMPLDFLDLIFARAATSVAFDQLPEDIISRKSPPSSKNFGIDLVRLDTPIKDIRQTHSEVFE